ncbi:MAG: LysM domain-containing protein, partial [Chloroflexota bacterium]
MKILEKITHSPRVFNGVSWGVTALIVVSLLGFTLWRIFPVSAQPVSTPPPTAGTDEPVALPGVHTAGDGSHAIVRIVALDTSFDENIRYDVVEYTVERGDTVSSIAETYKIKSASLMWANDELMRDGPNSLSVGQVLLVPPVDGVLYQWQEGDALE